MLLNVLTIKIQVHRSYIQVEIDRFVDDEIMVREALRLGLDQGDLIGRHRLIQK